MYFVRNQVCLLSLSEGDRRRIEKSGWLGENRKQSTLDNFVSYIESDGEESEDSAVHDHDSDYEPKKLKSARRERKPKVQKKLKVDKGTYIKNKLNWTPGKQEAGEDSKLKAESKGPNTSDTSEQSG